MKQTPRVLIVEDDLALNDAYQTLLHHSGYEVKAAFHGQQALEIVKDWEPHLIFLDLRMPVMDGLDFLRAFKPAEHPLTKVIIFSNYDMQEEVDEAYALGAKRYVLKAWASPKELLKIVEKYFSTTKK